MGGDKEIELSIRSADIDVILTVDGQEHMKLKSGDSIRIRKFEHSVRMYYFGDSKFFETLREKLGWKI